MTTPEIDAAREALAAAEAEVDRLRVRLRAELADNDARGHGEDRPEHRLGWADGVVEARRRHPKTRGTGTATATDDTAPERDSTAAGRAEAQRRARRRS